MNDSREVWRPSDASYATTLMNYTLVPYAHNDPPGLRYGNEGSLTTQRSASATQDATPGPDSPKFEPDAETDGGPAPERDEGAGES